MSLQIQKIDINKPESIPVPESQDMQKLFNECKVDLSIKLPEPKILLSIGYDWQNKPIPICTEGEFSCIVAPSKSKKSFFKSVLAASYIGGNSNIKCSHVTGHRDAGGQVVIDADTEQGKYYAQRTFERTQLLTGFEYKEYMPLYMRSLSAKLRLEVLDYVITKSPYSGKIKLMFIDGVADLVDDVNNLVLSNEASGYLLRWTDKYKIHICCVMHKAYGTDKATGHLGSAVTKKAETLIYIDPLIDSNGKITNFNTVKVRCGVSRGKMFEEFYMSVDAYGLPYTHDPEINNTTPATGSKKTSTQSVTKDNLFNEIDKKKGSKSDVIEVVKEKNNELPF